MYYKTLQIANKGCSQAYELKTGVTPCEKSTLTITTDPLKTETFMVIK